MPRKRYPPNTVGGRTVTAVPVVRTDQKIKDVERVLLEKADTFDTIDYIYIVNDDGVLKGVISIKELHASNKEANVEDVMKKKLIVARPMTHQERAVYLALSNKIKAIYPNAIMIPATPQ